MLKRSLILLVILYNSFYCFGQSKYFRLEGTINKEKGEVSVSGGFVDTSYLEQGLRTLKAKIINHKFLIEGKMSFPHGMALSCKIDSNNFFYTGLFFLEKGVNKIEFNIDSTAISPFVKSSITDNEYHFTFMPTIQEMDNQIKVLTSEFYKYKHTHNEIVTDTFALKIKNKRKDIEIKKDSILFQYTKIHQGSYVVLWKLIERFSSYGYKPIYDSIFCLLAKPVISTCAGIKLKRTLQVAKVTNVGQHFSNFGLLNKNLKQVMFADINTNSKYLFVDFWYSHCGPCIREFPKLIEIYNKYKEKGFQIAGISTDPQKGRNDWTNAIKTYKLPWNQYWDVGGNESSKLSINSYPTTFLLDGLGNIVAKNIEPEELEKFLNANLQ